MGLLLGGLVQEFQNVAPVQGVHRHMGGGKRHHGDIGYLIMISWTQFLVVPELLVLPCQVEAIWV